MSPACTRGSRSLRYADSVLDIVHAQYGRAMRAAAIEDSAARAAALAEARRLVGVAVDLRRCAKGKAQLRPGGRQATIRQYGSYESRSI